MLFGQIKTKLGFIRTRQWCDISLYVCLWKGLFCRVYSANRSRRLNSKLFWSILCSHLAKCCKTLRLMLPGADRWSQTILQEPIDRLRRKNRFQYCVSCLIERTDFYLVQAKLKKSRTWRWHQWVSQQIISSQTCHWISSLKQRGFSSEYYIL